MELIDAGKCLRIAQKNKGIKSAELGRMTGTSPQQMLRWRSNKNMKLHTMQLLTSHLDISIPDFITLSYR